MKTFKLFLLMISFLGIVACMPNIVTYYRPDVAGGILKAGYCAPAESMVEVSLVNGLRVRAWADNGATVKQVALFFSGGGWSVIHFSSDKFQLLDLAQNSIAQPISVKAYEDASVHDLTSAPYYAPAEKHGLFRWHVQVNFEKPMPKEFILKSPELVLDGKIVVLPDIRFSESIWFGISSFNC